ncbi:hypothetical protein D9M72_638250 [compost metagenome]
MDWRDIEDRVIAEAMGKHGHSRAEVIAELSKYSPGTITEDQKVDLTRRVYEVAPELVARYNAMKFPPKKLKR